MTEVEKPSFTQGLQNMVVYDGQKLTLQVEVAGKSVHKESILITNKILKGQNFALDYFLSFSVW